VKVVKETPVKKQIKTLASVKGVVWVFLKHITTSSTIRLFKNKSPSKLNVGEVYVCESVGNVLDIHFGLIHFCTSKFYIYVG
jgi:hypothetical protein